MNRLSMFYVFHFPLSPLRMDYPRKDNTGVALRSTIGLQSLS